MDFIFSWMQSCMPLNSCCITYKCQLIRLRLEMWQCVQKQQESNNIKYLPQEKETHSSTLFQRSFWKCALAPFCLSRILFISIPKNMSSKHIFVFKETLNNSIFIKNLSWHISFFCFKLLLFLNFKLHHIIYWQILNKQNKIFKSSRNLYSIYHHSFQLIFEFSKSFFECFIYYSCQP